MSELFTEAELRDLLQRDEGQFVEFKSLWDLSGDAPRCLDRRDVRDFIAENVAAFANADGGTLLLGVNDDGTPSGHGYPEEAVTEFLAVSERRLRPAVPIRHQRLTLDGHEIIILEVGLEPDAVMVDGNGFPYRAGDRVIREPQEIINVRKQAYRSVGFEQRTRPDATLDDLDLELAQQFFTQSIHRSRPATSALERLGLIHAQRGGYAISNAALLLFGRPPVTRWHPHAGIRLFRVAGSERQHGKHRNVTQLDRIDPPLAAAIPAAHRAAESQIRTSEKLHDLFFREMPEYPQFAWQEAIVNAVAHRDYNDSGREIEVWFFDDRLEVISPGDLVAPVTLEDIQQRRRSHASRNPLLVRLLVDVGIMREEGEGIPRIFDEMAESLLKAPEFSVERSQFLVTLRNEPQFSGPAAEWQGIVSQLEISLAQKRALLAYPDGFTNEQYRSLNVENRDQAYREIQELVSQGLLMPADSPGRGAFYHPAEDLVRRSDWLRDRISPLAKFFEQHLQMTNADYRNLFDLSRQSATRELVKLVSEGVLVARGERRGAHYIAGPMLARNSVAGD